MTTHARTEGGNRSRTPLRLPKAPLSCDHNVYDPCGWRDANDRKLGVPIGYGECADYFAAIHSIKNTTLDVEVICYWYPSVVQEEVVRKNLLGHLRRSRLRCPLGSTCTALHSRYRHLCFPPASTCNALFLLSISRPLGTSRPTGYTGWASHTPTQTVK